MYFFVNVLILQYKSTFASDFNSLMYWKCDMLNCIVALLLVHCVSFWKLICILAMQEIFSCKRTWRLSTVITKFLGLGRQVSINFTSRPVVYHPCLLLKWCLLYFIFSLIYSIWFLLIGNWYYIKIQIRLPLYRMVHLTLWPQITLLFQHILKSVLNKSYRY